jgi:NADH-quinone oxidoreductase subunit L
MDPVLACFLVILCLPLLAFLIQITMGWTLPRDGDWVSISAISGSFLLSAVLFFTTVFYYRPDVQYHWSFTWIELESFAINMGILFDPLTAIMLFVVTGVSTLIHFYSMGYMEGDEGYYRFFAYLSLFTFSMLGIVLTDSLFGLFIFWELVGVSSYFLIGFWYEKPSAAHANKKAFLTTRVGDLGMLLGIMTLVWYLLSTVEGLKDPLAYETLFRVAQNGVIDGTLLTAVGIMLFFGAVGKSAQLPLHVWLPDAMEGPTPVSALIHAATMVAAGVYMVARLVPFFSPATLLFIGYVGALTAFVAASVALVKYDVKKVLAYSTISQLGYMFLAIGLGGYVAGVLHLTTHAFFKALLFLGSGSIIHAVHSQDMRDMGGLWNKMPITFLTFFVATFSISGIPFFSGFYSKEKVLTAGLLFGWESGSTVVPYLHMIPYVLGVAAAGMTAFYMFRMVFMTFFGEPGDEKRVGHAHESPKSMWIPMAILGVLCFGFFFRAGPAEPRPEKTVGHHATVEKVAELPGDRHGESSGGHGGHGKTHGGDGKHGGGHEASHQGWFEVLVSNPSPLYHASSSTHHAAEVITANLSITIAGGGILLAAAFYANAIWLFTMAGVIAVLSLLAVNYWIWIVVVAMAGVLYLLEDILTAEKVANTFPRLRKLLSAKYYFDEFYRDYGSSVTLSAADASASIDDRIVDGLVNAAGVLTKICAFISGAIDNIFVDGLVEAIAHKIDQLGDRLRQLQTGELQWYLNMIVFGFGLLLVTTILFL